MITIGKNYMMIPVWRFFAHNFFNVIRVWFWSGDTLVCIGISLILFSSIEGGIIQLEKNAALSLILFVFVPRVLNLISRIRRIFAESSLLFVLKNIAKTCVICSSRYSKTLIYLKSLENDIKDMDIWCKWNCNGKYSFFENRCLPETEFALFHIHDFDTGSFGFIFSSDDDLLRFRMTY